MKQALEDGVGLEALSAKILHTMWTQGASNFNYIMVVVFCRLHMATLLFGNKVMPKSL